ncbi:hypothetical protein FPL11_03750 [Spiribacter aquaticus]|uniref:DUF4332 domain-containing protein n=2 Tax=Ectothiorhodospiraceae TaxID=72276 RepID=A0A557RJ72_9GAMM|nr:hypothetical protein FPL11_03750 [Spiribacter aquaticus]
MWNNLMRRWLEMATWWLPREENDTTHAPRQAAEPADSRAEAPAPAEAPVADTPASDDLTEIRGIGPAMQRRLTGLGIYSRADLAAADPETLTERLKADRAVVSQAQVAAWIDSAGH